MNNEKLVKEIIELGIPEKEARIYCALLQKRELTALQIQEIANVPRTKVYEFTKRMISKNMCIEKKVGHRKKYLAVEPSQFFQTLIHDRETEINRQRKIALELEKAISPIYKQANRSPGPTEIVEIIDDPGSIFERYLSFVRNAKYDYLGLIKSPYLYLDDGDKMRELDRILFVRIKKGVNVRMIYETPPENRRAWTFNYIRHCVRCGEHARVLESLPLKVYIFDQRQVMVLLMNPSTSVSPVTMFTIDHQPLASLAIALFEILWKNAQDYRILQYPPPR